MAEGVKEKWCSCSTVPSPLDDGPKPGNSRGLTGICDLTVRVVEWKSFRRDRNEVKIIRLDHSQLSHPFDSLEQSTNFAFLCRLFRHCEVLHNDVFVRWFQNKINAVRGPC